MGADHEVNRVRDVSSQTDPGASGWGPLVWRPGFCKSEPVHSLNPRLWCVLCLALVACNGGPISDLPSGHSGGNDVGGGVGGDDNAGSPPKDDDDGDGLSDPGSEDNGAGSPGGSDGAPSSPWNDAGAPVHDPDAGIDGGAEGDAGSACGPSSDGRPVGCYGIYCETSLEQLTIASTPGLACSDAAELALVCDGAITRTVTACLEEHVLAGDVRASVSACVRADGALSAAGDDCLACYVEESLCALENCLAPCLAAMAPECQACRAERCGAAFYACSGLPQL